MRIRVTRIKANIGFFKCAESTIFLPSSTFSLFFFSLSSFFFASSCFYFFAPFPFVSLALSRPLPLFCSPFVPLRSLPLSEFSDYLLLFSHMVCVTLGCVVLHVFVLTMVAVPPPPPPLYPPPPVQLAGAKNGENYSPQFHAI